MKFKRIIIVSIVALILFSGRNMLLYTPYTPLYRDSDPDHTIAERKSLLTPEHMKYIQVVLEAYDESFYVKDGVLYIKRTLQWDTDLLANFTSKALYMEREKMPAVISSAP